MRMSQGHYRVEIEDIIRNIQKNLHVKEGHELRIQAVELLTTTSDLEKEKVLKIALSFFETWNRRTSYHQIMGIRK